MFINTLLCFVTVYMWEHKNKNDPERAEHHYHLPVLSQSVMKWAISRNIRWYSMFEMTPIEICIYINNMLWYTNIGLPISTKCGSSLTRVYSSLAKTGFVNIVILSTSNSFFYSSFIRRDQAISKPFVGCFPQKTVNAVALWCCLLCDIILWC